jgi:3-hydroxyacyl-CoA dehydrogenase/enoyl-CoA hydratase/3-hydroxybutyryl-CoA epimerase
LFINDAKGKSKPKAENATFKSGCHRAGMMGAGIHVNAKAGIDVVLKDVSLSKAESGKDQKTIYNSLKQSTRKSAV